MANIALWLLALVIPLIRKILIGLGIGLVTYIGVDAALSQVTQAAVSSVGGIAGAGAQLAAILGFQKSVGIFLGALSTRLAITSMTKLGRTS